MGSLLFLLLELLDHLFVHLHFRHVQSEVFDQIQIGISNQLSEQVQERFLELVVGLGRNVVVLEISLSVEGDLVGFDFSVLDVSLVSDQANWGIGTDLGEVCVPLGDIPVGVSVGEIEHDDCADGIDVIAISELSVFFLSSCVPNIKDYWSVGGVEHDVSDDCSFGGNVGLLEVPGGVSLSKGGLSDSSVSYENEFEGWVLLCHN